MHIVTDKKREKNVFLQCTYKINFMSEHLQLIKKNKRSRIKSDKPVFTSRSCLGEIGFFYTGLNMNI